MNITDFLDKKNIGYKTHEPLKNYSTFKIGGKADYIIFPSDTEEITSCIHFLAENNIKHTVVGNGSNLVFPDEGYSGAVIVTTKCRKITVDGEKIHSMCGSSLSVISSTAQKADLTGFEFAYGIPGTCAGAVFMNAGAYGGEISSVFVECLCYDTNRNQLITLDKKDMDFSYRHSVIMDNPNLIILSALFSLQKGDGEKSLEIMQSNMEKRLSSQPYTEPNAGSVFKRPLGYFAGKLIQDCGLQGYSIGGAMVSTKHAGFIVNSGNATAENVRDLVEYIKNKVYDTYGVMLECEIRFI